MKKSNLLIIVCTAFTLILLVGCAPSKTPNLEPTTMAIKYEMPTINAVENYPELQERQGIVISTVPISFEKTKNIYKECEWIPNVLAGMLGGTEANLNPNVEYNYLVKDIPYFEVNPDELIFKVKIYNHLDRVLRLSGTVVAFQVDGKMINIEKANYQEFIDGFIIPRQEAEYRIIGPKINTLPHQCNIALLLYDIVTETDPAGNPTKKSNFEWFFTYKKEFREEPGIINKKTMKMTPTQARNLERK